MCCRFGNGSEGQQDAPVACFRKVRLTENVLKPSKINDLINEKKMLQKQAKLNSDSVEDKIEMIDQLISKE